MSLKRPSVLITGSNRGIGLGLAAEALNREFQVLATCRNPNLAVNLHSLSDQYGDQIQIVDLDVQSDASIHNLEDYLKSNAANVDVLINNAAVLKKNEGLGSLNRETLTEVFDINAISPLIMSRAILPFMNQNGIIVNISSQMGSMNVPTIGSYSYRASKAALNMFSRVLSEELKSRDIQVCVIHPGWVQTDMGGKHAQLRTEESSKGIWDTIQKRDNNLNGLFLTWTGEVHPW